MAFSTLETGGIIKVTSGGYNEGGDEVATLQLGTGKASEKGAKLTMGGKTGAVKDMLKKTNHMYVFLSTVSFSSYAVHVLYIPSFFFSVRMDD